MNDAQLYKLVIPHYSLNSILCRKTIYVFSDSD